MANSTRPVALVTGSSSGIGAELAREAAKARHVARYCISSVADAGL